MNKRTLVILAAVFGLIMLIVALLFKTKKVPDIKWVKSYRYESKEANGGWLLKEMIKQYYGEDHVRDLKDKVFDSLSIEKQLYVYFGSSYNYPKPRLDSLQKFIEYGNEVLFISNRINFPEEDSIFNPYNYLSLKNDSIFYYNSCDSSLIESMTFSTVEYDHSLDSLSTTGKYLLDKNDLQELDVGHEFLLCSEDTLGVFAKIDEIQMHFYFLPESFTNISSRHSLYLEQFNFVFGQFTATRVVLDHPSFHGSFAEQESQSPIQYILNTPTLAWAYYITLFSMLLFVVFGSKRKQKEIPLIEKHKNTSMDYVNVLSRLFQDQNQNHKLVKHMRDNFEHEVKRDYFIDANKEDYISVLAKKSKVETDRIKRMYRLFDKAKNDQATSDIQLSQLYSHIDYFHKNAQ